MISLASERAEQPVGAAPFGSKLRGRAWIWIAGNIAFWTAIAVLFTVQVTVRPGVHPPPARLLAYELASFVPCMLLAPAIAIFALRFRFRATQIGRAAVAHALGLVTFMVVGGAMMGAFEWLLPWERSGAGIASAAGRAIISYVASDVLIYTLIVATAQAFAYAREAQERSVAAARLQGQLAEARLHVLTSQLQPHFLFNTLHAISALVRESPIEAERLLVRLSELLRHALRSGMQGETSLVEELSFLEKYVEIQEARFGPRLRVTFEIEPPLFDATVPSLLLQPLVENAIRHGIARRPGPGTVQVSARREGERVRITVADDGVGLPAPDRIPEGIGLRTTRARLRQLYGDEHQFALTSPPAGGTLCTMVLPLRLDGNGSA